MTMSALTNVEAVLSFWNKPTISVYKHYFYYKISIFKHYYLLNLVFLNIIFRKIIVFWNIIRIFAAKYNYHELNWISTKSLG